MADDPELEAIRQRRMAQMMAAQGGGAGGAGGRAPATAEEAAQQDEQRQAQEEQRASMLHSIMQPAARDRLARISLVKPDKARGVEDMLIMAARRGQIQEKVSEARLIELLEQVAEQNEKKTKVTIQRRRGALDDDW